MFRLANFATMIIGTERLVDAVSRLGLEGIACREIPTR
ncbi:double-CXXCG motif protein [Myxococcus vastator]|nr:double-CXXCG motif protein [Myxococcus vastator]